MKRGSFYKLLVVVMLVMAAVLAVAVFALQPRDGSNPATFHYRTSSALLVALPAFGAALLFLSGIRQFKTGLRIAYILLASGIAVFGIALLQLPVVGFFNLWSSWWVEAGIILLPFVAAGCLTFAGLRQFSHVLGMRTKLASWWLATAAALAMTGIGFLSGHYVARYHSVAGTDMYIAIVAWSATYFTAASHGANYRAAYRAGVSAGDALAGVGVSRAYGGRLA